MKNKHIPNDANNNIVTITAMVLSLDLNMVIIVMSYRSSNGGHIKMK
jgi:hypothetical protein